MRWSIWRRNPILNEMETWSNCRRNPTQKKIAFQGNHVSIYSPDLDVKRTRIRYRLIQVHCTVHIRSSSPPGWWLGQKRRQRSSLWFGNVLECWTSHLAARMIWTQIFGRTSILVGWWFGRILMYSASAEWAGEKPLYMQILLIAYIVYHLLWNCT